ncbi:MAG: hypothetical protein K8F52_10675 [Candidatus Scalindua rubra]|uniref:Uncharacterized protein n=1 Tax=Candidatus Scalindua brodae TaxID=237368 RepID=A0A0B0EJU1_9BACT|nr:MAG: hypothetical protein SCABRO_03282 [Candidatus Scalindua brodae]MBZ0109122.1 hypothetical protein [Candidatus Scalindua rubra]TWU33558.1 hypothetical protein S225a_14480 [Candidatus Brocadiaceae bacterium S225]
MHFGDSFFWGVCSNFFTKYVEKYWPFSSNKNKKLEEFDTQFHIIDKKLKHKITNNVVFLDVDEKEFSKIAHCYMKYEENKRFIITNTKEPSWFYERFRKHVNAAEGDTEAKKLIINFESNIDNMNKTYATADKIANLFYHKYNDIKIFPHLKSFVTSTADKRVRINFFNLKVNNEKNRNDFKERNKKHEVIFFEKFINFNRSVESLFQSINEYQGTDALILNEERVLNHDDLINELHYQKNNFLNNINNGFFYNVVNNYMEFKNNNDSTIYRSTSDIWKDEKMYNLNM